MRFDNLADAVRYRIEHDYDGLRDAARRLGTSPANLSRLQNGLRLNPSPELLRKLGIREVKEYVL